LRCPTMSSLCVTRWGKLESRLDIQTKVAEKQVLAVAAGTTQVTGTLSV
jgi:hypothetical protein